MAQEIQIPNTQGTAKVRNPVAVALLSLTGIYVLIWYYKVNREMRDFGQSLGREDELGRSPGNSVLALFPGGLIIVPPIISLINTNKRIKTAQGAVGRSDLVNGWLALVLYLVLSPAMFAYWQSELNKVWNSLQGQGAPGGSWAAPPPPA
jgi:hypothetical protein